MFVRVKFTDRNGIDHDEIKTISFSELQNMAEQVVDKGQFTGLNGDALTMIEIVRPRDGGDGRPALWGRTSAFLRTR